MVKIENSDQKITKLRSMSVNIQNFSDIIMKDWDWEIPWELIIIAWKAGKLIDWRKHSMIHQIIIMIRVNNDNDWSHWNHYIKSYWVTSKKSGKSFFSGYETLHSCLESVSWKSWCRHETENWILMNGKLSPLVI